MLLKLRIYGHLEWCFVVNVHPGYTLELQRIRDGKYFRISGVVLTTKGLPHSGKTKLSN